jgi:isochorismate synthase
MRSNWIVRLPGLEQMLDSTLAELRINPCSWSSGISNKIVSDEEHESLVVEAVHRIKRKEFQKVVLSRIIESKLKNADSDVVQTFAKAFPHSCAFWIPISDDEVWFGSSPELLIEGNGGKWKTRSIAGTKSKNDSWGEKERLEQDLVTEGILNALEVSGATHIQKGDRYTFKSGLIEHLCTDIQFEFSGDLKRLIDAIHPSPAILGAPKLESMKWLQMNEPHNREWYTGTLEISWNDQIWVYAIIRCAKKNEEGIFWYVGGGITADSIAKNEVIETKNKVNSLEVALSSQM